jgi:mono/diheme cytochrome c family protein
MRVDRVIGAVVLLSAMAMVACSTDATPGTGVSIPEGLDPQAVVRGEALYLQYCASCHGADLSGDPDWKTPGPDGAYPPPPHDSSGHTWHHPDGLLLEIIRDGSPFLPSNMPAFGSVLTDGDVMAIIEYLKANWGTEEREYQRSVTEQGAASTVVGGELFATQTRLRARIDASSGRDGADDRERAAALARARR